MYGGEDSGYDEETQSQITLHTAVQSGSLQEIESVLASGEVDLLAHHDGQTALHAAVTSGRTDMCDVINLLLDNGADKNALTTMESNTALHLAVLHGNFPADFDLIILFLEAKVDLSIRNKALRTPYDCAVGSGQFELASCLDGTVRPEDARQLYMDKMGQTYGPYIIEAVLESNEPKLQRCIDLGGSPNIINKHGAGAIHYAVTHCRLPVYDTLLLLLHASADVNLQDEEGDTALNLVVKSDTLRSSGKMVPCVQLLVDSGAQSNIPDLDGKDACRLAEDKNYDDVLAILRGGGKRKKTPREDVNTPNADGLYPIHVATMKENKGLRHDKITSLLGKGALIDTKVVNTGNTSLHICAEKDFGETATLMLDHHIDYTIKNNKGQTAYALAKASGHSSVCEAIEKKQQEIRANWQRAGKKAKFCTIL